MKEKIDRLSKGIFEFETPDILISEDELKLTVDAGKIYSGSFTVKNSKNTPFKGILYSSSEMFQLVEKSFLGSDNIIHYHFHSENMNPGEAIKGEIFIVSDCGEIEVPFTVNIGVPYLNSSIGPVKDLFNFTNLAKADWAEAIKLFKTDEFRRVLMHHDTKYMLLYQNLIKSNSASQALEEFLITIRKKLQVTISANNTSLHYTIGNESVMDKVILTKDNWGYVKINLSTDAPFLSLEHKIIWSDNFVGNTYPLEFVLNPEFMRNGNNFGRIFLTMPHKTITIEVTCQCNKGNHSERHNPVIKEYKKRIVENYLQFRKNNLLLEQYIRESKDILEALIQIEDKNQDFYKLLLIHLFIISGKESQAKVLLDECESKALKWRAEDVITYCGYLYLSALLLKDEETIHNALYTIRDYYDHEYNNWKLLWLLLYIDKRYDNNKGLKLEEIKKQYRNGCKSPILYFEAVTELNEDPAHLHELGGFEIQVILWGVKNNLVGTDLAIQFTYLAGRQKNFNPLIHLCLSDLYELYEMKDILSAICRQLIKGHQRNSRYFDWFRLGVEEQLRITELHEYYMYTLDETKDLELPQPILLYFIYNSSLSDRKKAFLYAYIIKRKEQIPDLYHTYFKRMEQFAMKQLAAHNISRNLALIYEELITTQGLTPEIAEFLPSVMFKQEIGCNNTGIKGVFIAHKEMTEEVYTPFVNGIALVDIFTENAEIFLTDEQENRYTVTVEYTLNKLLNWEYYSSTCYELQVYHPMLLLNLAEKAQNYQKFDIPSVEVRKRLLTVTGMDETYHNNILMDLIQYYYDNFEGELLENYLFMIDIHGLRKTDRDKVVEFFIIRGIYDKALSALEEFGLEGIAINRLIKLCSYLLEKYREEEMKNDILVNLAYHIFKAGKYNEAILLYLVKYFFGTTGEMYKLWEAAVGFEMDTADLEERLLGQMLFAESYITNSISVFMQYYKKGSNHKLIKAFLSFNAYRYLVMDRVTAPELFDIMKKELTYDENEVCTLALLKKLSAQEEYTDNEITLIDYNIHKFISKGILLPFFKKFSKSVSLPPGLNDKFFIEYTTNPKHKVTIHYRLSGVNGEEEFTTEDMKNVYLGIHVKEFVLFYNENVQYYITEEEEEGQVNITESVKVSIGQDMKLEEDTRYNHINFMLTAMEIGDDKTLLDSIGNYIKTNHVIRKAFLPL